jgi:hypothetical protein
MTKSTLIAFSTAAVLAGGIAFGAFAGTPPVAADALVAAASAHPGEARPQRGPRGRAALRVAVLKDPALAAIANLRAIERIHRREGKVEELPRYLRGVLAKTNDPTVRNYVNFRLARLEMRERDPEGALAELQRGLDENLSRLR